MKKVSQVSWSTSRWIQCHYLELFTDLFIHHPACHLLSGRVKFIFIFGWTWFKSFQQRERERALRAEDRRKKETWGVWHLRVIQQIKWLKHTHTTWAGVCDKESISWNKSLCADERVKLMHKCQSSAFTSTHLQNTTHTCARHKMKSNYSCTKE